MQSPTATDDDFISESSSEACGRGRYGGQQVPWYGVAPSVAAVYNVSTKEKSRTENRAASEG